MSKGFFSWTVASVLSETLHIKEEVSKDVVKMFDEGNTVPFIARYRKERTNNMEPKEIHALKDKYEELKKLEEQLSKLKVQIEKLGQMTPTVENALKNCKSEEEYTYIAEPFKTRGSRTLAQRARDKGLEPLALSILNSPNTVDIVNDVPPKIRQDGPDVIEENICYIIADVIAKDMDVLKCMDSLLTRYPARLECKQSKSSKANGKKDETNNSKKEEAERRKFENYFDFTVSVNQIKSFQVLAINRGEAKKILTVKVEFNKGVMEGCMQFCRRKYFTSAMFEQVVKKAIEDAYVRLIAPHFIRSTRSKLKKNAVAESLNLFSDNLRQLLMTSPIGGKTVLGVDPGFSHGCKMAVIGPNGNVLETAIFYLSRQNDAKNILRDLLRKTNCTLIALGDGVGVRPTEQLLSDLLKSSDLQKLGVQFCIVSECGASIYSASPLAEKELSWLDVTYRGAVSIARRLQDPLSELVKIPPSNLGVGQYQHDLPEKNLESRVIAIVEECISLVGVDINYAPVHVLEHVAGLNKSRAAAIFDYRRLNGDFTSREQLLKVKGIGKASFNQFAGFVRIMPPKEPQETSSNDCEDVDMTPVEDLPKVLFPSVSGRGKKRKMDTPDDAVMKKRRVSQYCALDSTTVHPESYAIARRLIKDMNCTVDAIGLSSLREACKIAKRVGSTPAGLRLEEYTSDGKGLETIMDILSSLEKPIHFDLRQDFFKPMFRKSIQSIESLSANVKVSGRVTNLTQFGAFVDIGVGRDALLHISHFNNLPLTVGCRLRAVIQNVDVGRQRIGLYRPSMG